MNGFYQKNNIQSNISPMNASQKQGSFNFPIQLDNKPLSKNNNFRLQTSDKFFTKIQRSSNNISNMNISTSQVSGRKSNNLDALLKQSQKFISLGQRKNTNFNNLSKTITENDSIKTIENNKLNSSAFNFPNQNNNLKINNPSKVFQSFSQKSINSQGDSRQVIANVEQTKQKKQYLPLKTADKQKFDNETFVGLKPSQRSLSTTAINNHKNMINLSPQKSNQASYSNYDKKFDLNQVKLKSNPKIQPSNVLVLTTNSSQQQIMKKADHNRQTQLKIIKLQLQRDDLKSNSQKQIQKLQLQNSQKEKLILKLKNDIMNKNKMCEDLNKLLKLKYSEVTKFKDQFIIVQKQRDDALQKLQTFDDTMKIDIYQKKIYKLSDELQQAKSKVFQYSNQISKQTQTIKQLQERFNEVTVKNKQQRALKQINTPFINSEMIKNADTKGSKGKTQLLTALDQALKVQLKQIEELKAVIQAGEDEKLKLRQNLLQARRQIDVIRNQMTIIELKANSQRKNIITEYRLQIHQKQNQINSLSKKLKTVQQKYKNSLIHIKSKDEFLQQHLVGRTNQADVKAYIQNVLKSYSQNFDSILEAQNQNRQLLEKIKKYQKYQTA